VRRFKQQIDGFELPWENVQMVHNSDKIKNPPKQERNYYCLKQNPGIFFDNQFTVLNFLKSLLIDISGSKDNLSEISTAKVQRI
jgi:hypothetical protein